MNVHVNIDRIILDGINLSPEDRPILQAAIESELKNLIAAQGVWSQWSARAMPRQSASAITVKDSINPIELGQQIAFSVVGGLQG